MLSATVRNVRHAVRAMRRNPGFAAIAILTLALGIGANTAIFSVVYAVLLEPMAYPSRDPHEVVVLSEHSRSWDDISVSYPNFVDWKAQNTSFEEMAGFRNSSLNWTGRDEPLRLAVRRVSASYFEIMGAEPVIGRFFGRDEDQPGREPIAILNYRLWQNRFGSDPGVVGDVLQLDGTSHTILGVLPRDFEPFPEERAYISLGQWSDNRYVRDRGNHQGMRVLARLQPGVSFEAARTEMTAIAGRLEAEYPATNSGIGVNMERLSQRLVGEYRATLLTLLGAVSLVLLIACTNVANLLLVRAVSRKHELTIQTALGASRWRIVAQGLTEGLVLAVCASVLGVAVASGLIAALGDLLPEGIPRLHRVGVDWKVLAYTLSISSATGMLFGAVPALWSTRTRSAHPWKEAGRGTVAHRSAGWGLLVTEVALATTLLIGASLLIRSVYQLSRVAPGFRQDHVLTLRVELPDGHYDDGAEVSFFQELEDGLAALPGARGVAFGLSFPMMGSNWSSIFTLGDREAPPRAELPSSIFNPVSAGYFETFEIPLIRGRGFERADTADAPPVVVVNEVLADQFWPDGNAIGQVLKQGWPESVGEGSPWREIVGVVANTKQYGLDTDTRMQTYLPITQSPTGYVNVALRTTTDPLTLAESAKVVVRKLDPDLPVFEVDTMERVIASSIAPRRFTMTLFGIFAGLALVLSAVGLYGVISYSVASRTQEIGLRLAVGAQRQEIFHLVLRQGMILSALGAAVGLVGALALSRLLSTFLYGVTAADPLSYLLVPVVLILVALGACAAPALYATRVDPIRALRYE